MNTNTVMEHKENLQETLNIKYDGKFRCWLKGSISLKEKHKWYHQSLRNLYNSFCYFRFD